MSEQTQGRVALVTGANRGIGRETSKQLAGLGIKVLMAGRSEASIFEAARGLKEEGLDVEGVVLDVTNDEHIERVRAQIEREFGKLDILVNNAGLITGEEFFGNSAPTITRRALRETFEVNVISVIALTQGLTGLLEAAPAGRVVNLSSILGSLTLHADLDGELSGSKSVAYNASKAALNMVTLHQAAAFQGTNVLVNAAHPGWVKTNMGGEQAPMEIEDGAKTSVALATLGAGGPNGRYVHLGEELPW